MITGSHQMILHSQPCCAFFFVPTQSFSSFRTLVRVWAIGNETKHHVCYRYLYNTGKLLKQRPGSRPAAISINKAKCHIFQRASNTLRRGSNGSGRSTAKLKHISATKKKTNINRQLHINTATETNHQRNGKR